MKAAVFLGKDQPLQIMDMPQPRPVKDQVLIRLSFAAVNHRDLWLAGEQSTVPTPQGVILGSDGCGVVEAVGEEANDSLIGTEVVILPSLDWGQQPHVQGNSYRILGFPDNGTYAQYIAISQKYVFAKPAHLSSTEAAALPLAGLTAYRALFTKARLRAGERMLITGIGGGAALWALQLAVQFQARVSVTSGSEEKLAKAKALGASHGYNYRSEDWAEKALKDHGGFDVIIDCAGGSDFGKLIDLAIPGGRIVNFGRTAGTAANINIRNLYWKQLSIFGTTMGTRDEFLSLLEMCESRSLRPVIDQTFPLDRIEDAFAHMNSGRHFGKIIIQIP